MKYITTCCRPGTILALLRERVGDGLKCRLLGENGVHGLFFEIPCTRSNLRLRGIPKITWTQLMERIGVAFLKGFRQLKVSGIKASQVD